MGLTLRLRIVFALITTIVGCSFVYITMLALQNNELPLKVPRVLHESDLHNSSSNNSVAILIGIFSSVDNIRRRQALRKIYTDIIALRTNFHLDDVIDVRFILGQATDGSMDAALATEINRHKDILILDMPENMNKGKTYQFFKRVGRSNSPGDAHGNASINRHDLGQGLPSRASVVYDFVMKLDEDSYAHLPNMMHALRPLKTIPEVYFGRICNKDGMPTLIRGWPYMCGLGYILSWDLVDWLSNVEAIEMTQDQPTQFEDANTGYWLYANHKNANLIDQADKIFDIPNDGVVHGTRQNLPKSDSLILHELKNDTSLERVSQWYYSQLVG